MKILLLGSQGQLGWELARSLATLGAVLCPTREQGADLANTAALLALCERLQPEIIVNAAAYTAVDLAEQEQALARQINAAAPQALAQWAAAHNATLVHYSTDYVFDGEGSKPWRESDAPAPLSVYGATKLEGERAVEQAMGALGGREDGAKGGQQGGQGGGGRYLIFRTCWVYSARGANFIKTMLSLSRTQERLTVVNDQWGAPTGAELLADVTARALERLRGGRARSGLYHLCAAGHVNWHDYAQFIFDEARLMRPGLELKVRQIEGVARGQWPTAAQRPLNSRLDCSKAIEAFDLHLPDWREGVRRTLEEIL